MQKDNSAASASLFFCVLKAGAVTKPYSFYEKVYSFYKTPCIHPNSHPASSSITPVDITKKDDPINQVIYLV
jgi:hypothetical protein